MIIKYIADDGKEFETEEECAEYEYCLKMKDAFPTTRFFVTPEGKAAPFNATAEFCESLWFIEINDLNEAEKLHEWFNNCGFDSPWGRGYRACDKVTLGRFFWDSQRDEWRNVEELYKVYWNTRAVFERRAD